jgi:hypothetical protein
MGRLRQHVAWIVSGWLCCQLSLLTAVPLSLSASAPHAADSISCTCVHGSSGQCPMHHPATSKPDCQCRSASDPDAAAVVSLLGPIAVLPAHAYHVAPPAITKFPNRQITQFISFVASPDGPPPRA